MPGYRDTGTLARFSVSILEEGGRLGLKCLLLSYFRVGDFPGGRRSRLNPNPGAWRVSLD
jgi:hypothetical protein